MFPLRDDNPVRHITLTTPLLIAACVAAWVSLQGMGNERALLHSLCEFGLIPGELFGRLAPGQRVQIGPGASCTIGNTPWLTPVTSMFMHGSWFHLVGNLWFLWVFGNNVEDAMGRIRFVFFYLLCGLAAAAAQVAAAPASPVPMVGASGAIGGVMGAYAVLYPRARVHTLIVLGFIWRVVPLPAAVLLGYWFLLQIAGALPALGEVRGGVAFWAHIGGFLAGITCVWLFRRRG